MKRKRKLFHNYDDLLNGYYGFNKKTKMSGSASFDNGELIVQQLRAYGQSVEMEYVVESSVPNESEEEYVVQFSTAEDNVDEEYVVQASLSNIDFSAPNSLSYHLSETNINSLSDHALNINHDESDRGYQTSILNPFSDTSSISQSSDTYMPQSVNTYNTDTYNSISMDTTSQFGQDNNTNRFGANNIPANPSPGSNPQASAKEDELISDLQAILSGQKVYDSNAGRTVDRNQVGTQQSIEKEADKTKPSAPAENPHAIFDRIKENMQYANAYNLGTIPLNTNQLEKRFNDLESVNQVEKKVVTQTKKSVSQSVPDQQPGIQTEFNPTEFLHDLEAIQKGSQTTPPAPVTTTASQLTVETNSPNYPERPTSIRPYTLSEKEQIYGHFDYEPDPSSANGDGIRVLNNWRSANITSVSIPQLNGKRFGSHVIQNGTIDFHRLGADKLRRLWAAWEAAGLLDRITTFEGGYVARFIRGTQNRSPRPLSNHAWGTAFDINAPWNGFGNEPALMGQTGCVRELVSIANSNGFFWGGHFQGHKDGMHFELAKVL